LALAARLAISGMLMPSAGAGQIECYTHIVGGTRVHVDGCDARNRLQSRAHGIFNESAVGFDRPWRPRQQLHEEPGQRFVGVVVAAERDARSVRIPRQWRQAIQPTDHLDQCALHVGADGEAQVEVGVFRLRVAFDLLDPGHALHDLLERLKEFRLDFLGRGGTPASLDG